MAFERCIEKKPMTKIALRDIAEEAGVAHPKLLHYFENRDEFRERRETMEQCLTAIYGPEVGKHEAEAMMILIAGTFICNNNGALTGEISGNTIGYPGNLTYS